MHCQDVQDRLEAFVTRRLSVAEQADVRRHFAACVACTQEVETIATLKALVQTHATTYTAPPELRTQVAALLGLLEPVRTRSAWRLWRRWRWAGVAAGLGVVTALLLMVLWWPLPSPQQRLGTQVLAEVVQMHRALAARQAPLSPLDLDHFHMQLQARLGFVPPVPWVSDPEFQLLGGEFTQVANRPAARWVYWKGQALISLVVLPGHDLEMPEPGSRLLVEQFTSYFTQRPPYRVLLWKQGPLTYSVAADVDQEKLAQFFLKIHQG